VGDFPGENGVDAVDRLRVFAVSAREFGGGFDRRGVVPDELETEIRVASVREGYS